MKAIVVSQQRTLKRADSALDVLAPSKTSTLQSVNALRAVLLSRSQKKEVKEVLHTYHSSSQQDAHQAVSPTTEDRENNCSPQTSPAQHMHGSPYMASSASQQVPTTLPTAYSTGWQISGSPAIPGFSEHSGTLSPMLTRSSGHAVHVASSSLVLANGEPFSGCQGPTQLGSTFCTDYLFQPLSAHAGMSPEEETSSLDDACFTRPAAPVQCWATEEVSPAVSCTGHFGQDQTDCMDQDQSPRHSGQITPQPPLPRSPGEESEQLHSLARLLHAQYLLGTGSPLQLRDR